MEHSEDARRDRTDQSDPLHSRRRPEAASKSALTKQMLRGLIDLFALALCLGSFALIANGKARSGANPPHEAPPPPTRVLLIGVSLSVGAFGEAVQQHLASRFGPQSVMAFASCGSSP